MQALAKLNGKKGLIVAILTMALLIGAYNAIQYYTWTVGYTINPLTQDIGITIPPTSGATEGSYTPGFVFATAGEGTAEWTTEQANSGSYSVNLNVEASADFACALIPIPSGERPQLKDITTAGFMEYAKASSTSAYRADYCLNLVSTQIAVWDWGVTGTVGVDWDMIHMDNQWFDDAKSTWLSRDVTTDYNGWSNSHIEGLPNAEDLDWFKQETKRGDMYVAGVMVAIGGPGHNGYDGYIDDITFNGETYDLEAYATIHLEKASDLHFMVSADDITKLADDYYSIDVKISLYENGVVVDSTILTAGEGISGEVDVAISGVAAGDYAAYIEIDYWTGAVGTVSDSFTINVYAVEV